MKSYQLLLLLSALTLLVGACGESPELSDLSEEEVLGQRLFLENCAACHAADNDLVIVGPSLAGIRNRAGERVAGQDAHNYILDSILDPAKFVNEGFTDLMPRTFGDTLTAEELEALIAYLYRLD